MNKHLSVSLREVFTPISISKLSAETSVTVRIIARNLAIANTSHVSCAHRVITTVNFQQSWRVMDATIQITVGVFLHGEETPVLASAPLAYINFYGKSCFVTRLVVTAADLIENHEIKYPLY